MGFKGVIKKGNEFIKQRKELGAHQGLIFGRVTAFNKMVAHSQFLTFCLN